MKRKLVKKPKKVAKWKKQEVKRQHKAIRGRAKLLLRLALLAVAAVIAWRVVVDVLTSRWSGDQRVNIVLVGNRLEFFSYDPEKKSAVVVEVPGALMIETAYGYGEYRAAALAALDKQEKKKGRLIADSMANYFGVMVDGYIVDNQRASNKTEAAEKQIIMAFLARAGWGRLFGGVETNLSFWDVARLWQQARQFREDELEIVNLTESSAIFKESLPDKTIVYKTDALRLTALAERLFVDESLVEEGVAVVVRNTTDASGLGAGLARMLSSSGVYVIAVEDNKQKIPTSEIWIRSKDLRRSGVVKRLEDWLGRKSAVDGKRSGEKADVVVMIGEDYRVRLLGKDRE